MKTFLIIIETLALVAAAYLTRPTEEDLHRYMARASSTEAPVLAKVLKAKPKAQSHAATSSEQYTCSNYYLWTDVRKNGQTVYIGAFSHWFPLDMRNIQ